jgi:hypothetical protein
MPIPVTWYKDTVNVIVFEFPVEWTWDEFWEAKAISDQMMDEVDRNYALILHAPANVRVPDNAISQGRSMINRRHPRADLFVIVSSNAFVRSLIKILGQFYLTRRKFLQSAPTLEAAEAILRAEQFLASEMQPKAD